MNRLGNIQHPTSNAEHPMAVDRAHLSMMDDGWWMLGVSFLCPGGAR